MNVLTKGIQKIIPKCMFFVDDLVLIEKSRKAINSKLELWGQSLEIKGFHLSKSKTKYIILILTRNKRKMT